MAIDSNEWTIRSSSEEPELPDRFYPQKARIWPEFMFHDVYSGKLWRPYLTDIFADYQLYLLNKESEPIAVAHSIPLTWDGTMSGLPIGWNDCLIRAAANFEAGIKPDTLAAIEITIQSEYHGQGISYRMIKAMRGLAAERGLKALIAAVRPIWKTNYPLTPMERYVRWQQEDGAPFDPWLRVHWRIGGEILKVAHPSMLVEASADEWEKWTGMKFPESGDYIVPGALAPVQIDREMNLGRYVEPNIWVHHPITTERLGKGQPIFQP